VIEEFQVKKETKKGKQIQKKGTRLELALAYKIELVI
jgi:hypothetical protein